MVEGGRVKVARAVSAEVVGFGSRGNVVGARIVVTSGTPAMFAIGVMFVSGRKAVMVAANGAAKVASKIIVVGQARRCAAPG